ncbi:hypothetical protein DL766_007488 [Monosporascus sp. MC13-8B]|uniref:Metallo-beta-lactamase domain-containing protein n=1 Tax=Monosporascus cannonballus TaxID=155416 RepID=A0ABY0GWZ1_9PEZI|nr:hypothetical protein DL762_008417 [Monosporascus cannonballus]RYO82896.1 hypothetical protein DL763_008071 [Monosporascus cannonballus]RYP23605.1 hypothetical protein DL766_007488 [Monosporascus sp. MC13-8B]
MTSEPAINHVFHPPTGTWQFVVADPTTKSAVIIDPVLDFDPAKATISTLTADALLTLVCEEGYKIEKLLETHAHADHITAASYLQTRLAEQQQSRPDVCIGRRISQVQETFAPRYGIPRGELEGAFDHLFEDDETFCVGSIKAKAIHLPGHTPDSMGYVIGSNVFCGDSLFNADVGSARCDFPGGNALDLYASVRKILSLPENFKIWTGHDYPPGGEGRTAPLPCQTVREQKERNKHFRDGAAKNEFVEWRMERDGGLGEPRLLHYSLQVNVRGGRLPRVSDTGDRMLHVPIKFEGQAW